MRRFGIARRSEAGFSLIEVLAAVVVLSIALVAGFRLISQQTQVAAGLEDRVFSHWVALNALEEVRLGLQPPAEARMAGIDWQVDVQTGAGPAGLRRYEVLVQADDRAGARLVGFLAPEPVE